MNYFITLFIKTDLSEGYYKGITGALNSASDLETGQIDIYVDSENNKLEEK